MNSFTAHSVPELAEVVRQAASTGMPIFPTAGGTQEHLLAPIASGQSGIAVNLLSLNQIIDYPHRDLTITLQAGVTLTGLQRVLAEQGQTFPLDVPLPDQATVGGSIAANVNGPRRTGWGTWRDYVIGLTFLNDRGEEVKAGGRVVKNVAGYDLCKLLAGSFGTLGLLTQVTLKVRPRPEKLSIVPFQLRSTHLSTLLDALRSSRVRPAVQVLTSLDEGEYRLDVGFEDSAVAVDWQVAHIGQECQPHIADHWPVLTAEDAEQYLTLLATYPLEGTSVTIQAAVPGSQVASFLQHARPLVDSLQAYPAVGILTGHLPHGLNLQRATASVSHLRRQAEAVGGHLTLRRCPAEWRSGLLPWGPPRPDWPMMRKIKHALDPRDLFQRGRFDPLFADASTA